MSSRIGAIFSRMDLQIHTPRDPNWHGAKIPGVDSGASPADVANARAEWARLFVDACLRAGLGAAAITDHHDWVMIKPVRDELEKRWPDGHDAELWVYPGVEVTCKDSAQALLLFDADVNLDLLNRLPARLKIAADRKPLETNHPPVQLLDISIEQLQDVLDDDPELKERFIVLPNVKPNGHKTILRQGFHMRYAAMPYVGGYLEGMKPSQIGAGERKILNGEVEAWGSKRIPPVNTSDARGLDLIGVDTPWVKVGARSAEALRQAFLAPDSRLSENRPSLPTAFVSRVKVTGAKVLQDVDELLNPQLIALIGGRGSGKSTLLEYLRFGLGYGPNDSLDSEPDARRSALIRDTLIGMDAQVELEISINGSSSVLRRTGMNSSVITQVFPDGTTLQLTSKDVRSNFPFQAYSQGELSKLGELGAGDKIKALILAPISEATTMSQARYASIKSQLRSAFEGIVQMWKTDYQLREAQIKMENLNGQLVAVKSLTDQAPTSQIVLADKRSVVLAITDRLQRVSTDLKATAKWLSTAPKLSALNEINSGLEQLGKYPEFNAVANKIRSAAVHTLGHFTASLPAMIHVVAQAGQVVDDALDEWGGLRQSLETEYTTALQQAKEFESALKMRNGVEEAIAATEQALRDLRSRREALEASVQHFEDLRKELNGVRQEQRAALVEMAGRFQELSKTLARASVIVGGNDTAAREAMKGLTAQTRTRQERLDALFEWLQGQPDPHGAWGEVQDECLAYLRWRELGSDPTHRPVCAIIFEKLGEAALSKISPERVVDVVSNFLEDDVRLGYVRGDDEVSFNTASPGEQATALLAVLLSQVGGPLILDQPEDDLDNKIIKDIVEYIRTAKQRRQIIVATHNANLVVNGDAEQVLHFAPTQTPTARRCSLCEAGAIDTEAIKDAITSTMEGGRAAFELRRTKYRF